MQIFDTTDKVENQQLSSIYGVNNEAVSNILNLDKYAIVVCNNIANYKYNETEDLYHGLDVNIAVASTVT